MKVAGFTLLALFIGLSRAAPGTSTQDALDEIYGYVDVREGAHMFWVAYHVDQPGDWTDYPLILWLQGGPGSSGVGYGNFEEMGPYFVNQSLRETAWTKKANLMFIDNPVGTGYSYVDELTQLCSTNAQIATDLVEVLKSVFTDNPDMQVMPFYIFAESYGGKMTVDTALALDAAIKNGEIVSNFQGVALGDSWISPMDSVNTWGTFLYHMGFVDTAGQAVIDESAANAQAACDSEDWIDCTDEWGSTESTVYVQTNGVDFYNVLAKEDIYQATAKKHLNDLTHMRPQAREPYVRHVLTTATESLDDLMNNEYHDRWGIPDGVVWGAQSSAVFDILYGDFMKPVVDSVVQLLETTDLYVSVYTGDLDLICDTPGTYRWIENMQFSGKSDWDATRRKNFYVTSYSTKAGYVQNNANFGVYTVLRSGHMTPVDAPVEALALLDLIFENSAANQALKTKKSAFAKAAVQEAINTKAAKEEKQAKEAPAKENEEVLAKKAEEVLAKKVEEVPVKKVEENPKIVIEKPKTIPSKDQKYKEETKEDTEGPTKFELNPQALEAHRVVPLLRSRHVLRRGHNQQQKREKVPAVERKLNHRRATFGL